MYTYAQYNAANTHKSSLSPHMVVSMSAAEGLLLAPIVKLQQDVSPDAEDTIPSTQYMAARPISQPPFPLKRWPLSFSFTSACPARKQMAASSAHMTHNPNQRIHSLPMPELLLGLVGVRRPLQCVVEQQLFDQVHVRHEHAPATIPHQAQRIQRISAQGRKISLGDAWSQGRAWDDSIAWRRRGCQSIHMI